MCFNAPSVETFRVVDRHRHPACGGLGPNICEAAADLNQCIARIRSYPHSHAQIADVLVDERVMRGVGNVFRSELLWITELSPCSIVADLPLQDCWQLVNAAHRLLGERVGGAADSVLADTSDKLNVYGRNGQRCARCGDTIESARVSDSSIDCCIGARAVSSFRAKHPRRSCR